MSHGYLVLYFPETGEFSSMPARNSSVYMGKKYFITYEDREEPYMGVVKGICETEKQAEDLIERFTNVDETTLRILRQKMPSLQVEDSKFTHLSSRNIKFYEEDSPTSSMKNIAKVKKWYKNGELIIETEDRPPAIDMEKLFEESGASDKKMEKKLKMMKKKKST